MRLILSDCMMAGKIIKKGDKVKVEYEGRFEDGVVFDSSKNHGQPLEFEVGEGRVISGFDKAVTGMKKGEEKEFTLKPEEAYGERRAELEQEIPKDKLPPVPEGQEIKEGMMLVMGTPDGRQMPVKITKVGKSKITLDLNHPLAGKTLIFKIKILDVE